MTKSLCPAVIVILASSLAAFSQTADIEPTPTPVKVVITNNLPRPRTVPSPTPRPVVKASDEQDVELSGSDQHTKPSAPIVVGNAGSTGNVPRANTAASARVLNFSTIKSKLAEAKRQMQSRPVATTSVESAAGTNWVRIAFHDWKTNAVDYIVIPKTSFLSTTEIKQGVSSNGRNITVQTIRGNGVNTPVIVTDETGQMQLPLIVQYPVEKGGRHVETAYYISTHPGLVTPEVVNAGRFYVRNVIEIARDKLKDKGITIHAKVADIAERLSTVEHVDHQRFRNEPHSKIYDDIFTLYALNEGQTYRYSVSSAGAGGMVQMIPSTYRMVRARYPQINLMPDFVEGMRDHVNATQAMLLYMQWTWSDLISNPTVANAVASGIATQEQLMAAGYNSNPARLPGYINRGGANWTTLIPRETKIYLQIYESIERFVPMTPRSH